MSFIETTTPECAQGEVQAMYTRQQSAFGFVPNYARVFCHRPGVMIHWTRLLSAIHWPQSTRRFELVTFAAAQALKSSYCTLAHGSALTEFMQSDEVRALAVGEPVTTLTEAEHAMMSFARKVAVDAPNIAADDIETLKSHGFKDNEIFDIAATVAARCFFTRLLDALGAMPDGCYHDMDENLKRTLTVGRPIESSQR